MKCVICKQTELRPGKATVTLERPTMPPSFFTEIEAVFREINADIKVRAVVLRVSRSTFGNTLQPDSRRSGETPTLNGECFKPVPPTPTPGVNGRPAGSSIASHLNKVELRG